MPLRVTTCPKGLPMKGSAIRKSENLHKKFEFARL